MDTTTPTGHVTPDPRATLPMAFSREVKLSRTFVDLADTFVDTFDLDEFLHMLCQRACEVLDVQAAGVMIENERGQLQVSAATSQTAGELDLLEMQAGEGPCFDAYKLGTRVLEPDLAMAADRWPRFATRALEAGFGAVYGFPMRLRGDCIGAMNIFRVQPGELDERDVAAGQALADLATIGLLSQRRISEAETRAEQLNQALASRVLIEQAKGALAERAGITPNEAFERIRRYSRSQHRTIRSLCPQIIDGTLEL